MDTYSLYINGDAPLKNGGRKAVAGYVKRLDEICVSDETVSDFLMSSEFAKIKAKDGKYIFNTADAKDYRLVSQNNINAIEITTESNGNLPIIFYVYMSAKGLRMYMPLKGNLINRNTKCALGFSFDHRYDAAFLSKELDAHKIIDCYGQTIDLTSADFPNTNALVTYLYQRLVPNPDMCLEDFYSRVEVDPAVTPITKEEYIAQEDKPSNKPQKKIKPFGIVKLKSTPYDEPFDDGFTDDDFEKPSVYYIAEYDKTWDNGETWKDYTPDWLYDILEAYCPSFGELMESCFEIDDEEIERLKPLAMVYYEQK